MKRKIVYEDDDENGYPQLEVKSSADEAWYNASVEVLDDTVHVRFDEFPNEDEIWDVNYLREHAGNISNVIRRSSPQLQDADCTSVVEDMVVCARHVKDTDHSEDDGVAEEVKYFDAMITCVTRMPHTFSLGEECCFCVFEAYWLSGPDKKKHGGNDNSVFLSCGDICMLHPGTVELHPVVKKIMRLLDSRILGRRLKQPVEELSKSGKSETKTCGIKKTGERRKCSPISSQETEELDSDRMVTRSTLSREASSKEETEVRARQMPQRTLGCDTARRAVESEASECSRSSETVASEDLSSPLHSSKPVVKKPSRLDGSKHKHENDPISPKEETENASHLSPQADSSELPVKRMRGSVTNLASPPAWFKPAGGS